MRAFPNDSGVCSCAMAQALFQRAELGKLSRLGSFVVAGLSYFSFRFRKPAKKTLSRVHPQIHPSIVLSAPTLDCKRPSSSHISSANSMSEPDWDDADASREFLERDYTGSAEAGSQFYQYCMDKGRDAYRLRLVEHLSAFELSRYLEANQFTGGIHISGDSTVIYPGYKHPGTVAALQANTQKSTKPKDPQSRGESSATKRKLTARPESYKKSRPSKRQGVSKPQKRTKPKKTMDQIMHRQQHIALDHYGL